VACASLAESVFISLFAEALAKADVYPWLNPCFLVQFTANSQSKSTAGYPKSTVDLLSQSLIWVEKWPANALSPGLRHSFCPITTWELWDTGQMQTDAGQKRIMPLTVLGMKKLAQNAGIRLTILL